MNKTKSPKKKTRKAKNAGGVDDLSSGDEDIEKEEEDESGMFLEKEDVNIIYNALSKYKPAGDEEQLHGILLEQFEEILAVDYNEVPLK